MSFSTERRRHPRAEINSEVEIGTPEGPIRGRMRDISRLGVAFSSDHHMPVDSLLALDFGIEGRDGRPDVAVTAQAAVVRSDPMDDGNFDVALYFLAIDEESKRAIDEYVASACVSA